MSFDKSTKLSSILRHSGKKCSDLSSRDIEKRNTHKSVRDATTFSWKQIWPPMFSLRQIVSSFSTTNSLIETSANFLEQACAEIQIFVTSSYSTCQVALDATMKFADFPNKSLSSRCLLILILGYHQFQDIQTKHRVFWQLIVPIEILHNLLEHYFDKTQKFRFFLAAARCKLLVKPQRKLLIFKLKNNPQGIFDFNNIVLSISGHTDDRTPHIYPLVIFSNKRHKIR